VAISGEDAYDTLLEAMGEAGAGREAAEQAMMDLDSDVVTAKLLAGYFDASDQQKPSLLRVLASRELSAVDPS